MSDLPDWTPEEIEVLRAIEKDGIDAYIQMPDTLKEVADKLEHEGYLESFGDSYDFNWYLTQDGRNALEDIEDEANGTNDAT